MKNIKNNLINLGRIIALTAIFGLSISRAQGVFISEYAEGSSNNKYIEIYNNTSAAIDLSTYQIWRISNGGDWAEGESNSVQLEGSVAPGDVWIVCNSSANDEIQSASDLIGSTATFFNGDDAIGLAHNGTLIDLVGDAGDDPGAGWPVAGIDNATGEHTLVRKANISIGNIDWVSSSGSDATDSEWIVLGQDDFSNIGTHTHTPSSPFARVWKLIPEAGSLVVSSGENATGSVHWQNDAASVATRACLFDDKYILNDDGTFVNDMGTETWLETWQGVDEGCGAPILPHDGSNSATWSYNETDMSLTLDGVGAYFALAKAYNGGELGSLTDAVPNSRTYDILSFDGNLMTLSIQVGDNYWTFKFVREDYDPFVDVTFSVDMNDVDTHPEGVYLAGGQFGQEGVLMNDSDGDDIWKVTVELAINQDVTYKFRNQPSFGTWDGFEDANALEPCGFGEYNDRIVSIGDQDFELPLVCYASCYACDFTPPPPPIANVTFYLDMTDQTVSEQGVYVAGSIWGEPNDGNQSGRLIDYNGDGVFEGTFELSTGSSIFYTYTNGHNWSSKENIEGQSCANPSNYNDRDMTVNSDTTVFAKFQDCDATYSDSVYVEFTLDMGDEVISDAGLFLAGGSYFGGPWEGRYPFTLVEGTNNVWFLADSFPAVLNDAYTYVNGTDWGNKENIQGQDCAFGQYSDREFRTTIVDRQINHCFGLCGEGSCETIGAPDTASVKFRVDMTGVENISPDGVHLAGGPFGGPWEDNYRMIDFNHDGVFEIEVDLVDGGTYDYTFTNGMSWDVKENIQGQSCAVDPHSDRRITVQGDMIVNHRFGDCDYNYSDSVYVEITLDMGDEVVSDDGLWLAGGNYFGGPWDQRYPFTQVDSLSNKWFVADSFPVGLDDAYTYVNGMSWGDKENIEGQECAFGQYNDRHFYTTIVDQKIDHCFSLCGNGNCLELTPPETVTVLFSTDANEYNNQQVALGFTPLEVIHATGSFEGWSGYGVPMTDEDGDGIYIGETEIVENTAFEYKYIVGGWGSFESGAEIGGPCDWNPDDTFNNYGAYVGNSGITLPTYVFGGGCRISGDPVPDPGIIFSGTFGGTVRDGQTYINPTGSEDYAGFANEDVSVYPFSFPYGGSVAFEAHTNGNYADIYFRFEYNPYPDVEPSFLTEMITISTSDPAFYEVSVPPQGDNTYSSFLLYVVTTDVPVTLTQVEVISEETEQYVYSSYTLEVSDAASYNAGSESTLPAIDVEGEGVVITATFNSDDSAPYTGALAIYWDANFNDSLDYGDINILDELNDDDYYYYDDYYNSRDHENSGTGLATLIDNDPSDADTTEGVYVLVIDDAEFMEVQGATFFFAALDADLVVTQTVTAKPFSSSPLRFTGTATEMTEQALPVEAVFVEIGKDVGYYSNDYYYYETEDLTEGITGLDGSYDIGVSLNDVVVGDIVRLYPYHFDQDRGGRLLPLIDVVDDSTGDVFLGNETSLVLTDAMAYNTDIEVMKLNTLVQGFAYGFDGQPLSGEIYVFAQIGSGDNIIDLFGYSEVDDNGYYSFWAQNGTELEVMGSFDGGPFVEETFFLQAETFDEGLGAFVYNYNIDATPPQQTGFVQGHVHAEEIDEYGYNYIVPLAGVEVQIYNNDDLYIVFTDENGNYMAEVNAPANYFISAVNNIDGYTNYDNFVEVFVDPDSYVDGGHIVFYPQGALYTVSGYVYDQNDQPVVDADVDFAGTEGNNWYDYTTTDTSGYYSISVLEGMYDILVFGPNHYTHIIYGVDISEDMTMNFIINQIGVFDGAVQGVVTFTGENAPDGPAHIDVFNDSYGAGVHANDDGFYSIDLIDGVYNISVNAPGYEGYYRENAFEISGNTVTYNVELFEYGYAGAPQMIDLYDVANDQGRQMRAVWHAGMPGSWNYFTQFSIWRKVNNAPVDLWDYIETVPWHGMDPYAAVVPTLGDSSSHGIHMSTFMVTAHTEDVSFWIDSEPMSGYSIDNLHPSVPMGLAFSTSPGSVSLNWSGPVEEDFSFFNIYRQDILTNEPAVVFTTTDSFYVDQELSDVGAYEYWVTAVDMSGLESDASSIVSAVLSAEEKMGMPTEFALKQNYPNPFNPSTQIQYALPTETRVLISIYDLTGRRVRTLVNEVQSAGHRSVMWNATNEIGRPVSAGMYIYTIQAVDFIQNRKMVLLK